MAWKDFFDFPDWEKKALLALFFLVLLEGSGPLIQKWLFPRPPFDPSLFEKEYLAWEASLIPLPQYPGHSPLSTGKSDSMFFFDPNKIGEKEWVSLGLSTKQAAVIQRYIQKGGKFREPDDLRKMWVISPEFFQKLRNWIQINELADPPDQKPSFERFIFDPNTCSENDLARLGIAERVIKNLIRYREKGGRFRKIDDLSKIHGMDSATFASLKSYILLPPPETIKPGKPSIPAEPLELNSADSAGLESLPGIGPVLARRIVAYRSKLGGFYHKDQLLEVKDFDQELLKSLESRLQIHSEKISRLNLNFASREEMARHPYIGKEKAREIEKLRSRKGPLRNMESLISEDIFTAGEIKKIEPYLEW